MNCHYKFAEIPTTRNLPKFVVQTTVKKSVIIAYFGGGEREVIVITKKDGDLMDVGVLERDS